MTKPKNCSWNKGLIQAPLQHQQLLKVSLKNHTLQEIVDGNYLQTVFEDAWGKPSLEAGALLYCNETCGNKSKIDNIYTHDLDTRPGNKKIQNAVKEQRKQLKILS